MASFDETSSSGTGSRGGRRSKRGQKSKVSSFADEVPSFIEELIPGTEPPQTVRYVRLWMNLP
jgi:hypothetical protein